MGKKDNRRTFRTICKDRGTCPETGDRIEVYWVDQKHCLTDEKYLYGFSQVDDIINEGVIVMMNAVDKYDSSKNAKFETYISKRIKGMIIDLARKQDWIPRSVRKSVKDVEEAIGELHSRDGQYPSEEKIAEYLQIPLEKYHEIMKKSTLFNILSLDMVLAEAQDSYSGFQLPQGEALEQPEKVFLKKEVSRILVDGIQTLKEKEQLVISLYYVEELNMRQIADILEVSEQEFLRYTLMQLKN